MRNTQKFSRFTQPSPCHSCGKNTTGVEGTQLCRPCYERAGWENKHSDEGHNADNREGGCPICAEEQSQQEWAPVAQKNLTKHDAAARLKAAKFGSLTRGESTVAYLEALHRELLDWAAQTKETLDEARDEERRRKM